MKNSDGQAELLSQYWAALGENPAAPPPPRLDPADAALARRLRSALRSPQPRPAFREQLLRQQLEAQAKLAGPLTNAHIEGGKEGIEMQSATTFAPRPRLSGLFGRFATAIVIVALLIGSIAVANDLIKRQQHNLVTSPTPSTSQTALATAQATPCTTSVMSGWHSAAGYSSTVSVGSAASDGTYVYAVGGNFTLSSLNDSNQLLRYDPTADKWTALAPAPDSFSVGSAVYSPINKKLYVFGGTHGPTQASGTLLTDTRIYDPATNTWSSGAPLPVAHELMAAGYWNGKIYLVGGVGSLTSIDITAQTWEYDPLANTWATRAARPAQGSGFGYGIINGHLYTTGGYYPVTGGFSSATYDYDIAADTWTARASEPKALDYSGSAVIGNQLYIFGGIAAGLQSQSKTYIYDPASDIWTNGPDLAQARMMPVGAGIGNTLLSIGGSNFGQMLNSVEVASISCATAPPAAAPPPQTASTDHPYLFPQTGKTIGGKFRAYWEGHGGLAQQGYAISNEFTEISALDGKPYTVQYFERAVMELHPENAAPSDVLLSQLGTFRFKQKYPNGAANEQPSTDNPTIFPETGKTVGGKFLAYWKSHGGLAQQGYPISDEFQEKSDLDGKTYTVQYFERAVFELHPENAGTAYEVELSQLGTFQYKQKYPTAP